MRYQRLLLHLLLAFYLAGCSLAGPAPSPTATMAPTPTLEPTPTPPPELTTEDIEALAQASVLIEALVIEDSELTTGWSGSGTVLTPNGAILTNAHVVIGARKLVVSMIRQTDLPPIPSFYARPLVVNNVLDLALLEITTDIDGNVIDRDRLQLAHVPLGDSDMVQLGQDLHVFGYPGVGGETISFTVGTVSGFESENLGRGGFERVWIKSDAEIAPGNSGGAAIDNSGRLVGIPTMVQAETRTAGRMGNLRPSNLVDFLIHEAPPRITDAMIYEPNDTFEDSYGPLEPGEVYRAFLHEYDVDLYTIDVESLDLISVYMTDIPAEADYDLYLFDENELVWDLSRGEEGQEYILFEPFIEGRYYIAVIAYEGYSLEHAYALQAIFNGVNANPILPDTANVSVRGRLVDADSGRGLEGAIMTLLVPGVTGEEYLREDLNPELVLSMATTDIAGDFLLTDVPRGHTYAGVVIIEGETYWANDWLTIERTDPGIVYVGTISIGAE